MPVTSQVRGSGGRASARRQRRLGSGRVGDRDHDRLRGAFGGATSAWSLAESPSRPWPGPSERDQSVSS